MKRLFKLIIIGLSGILGSILLLLLAYDLIVFLPHHTEIQTLISEAPQLYKFPPVQLINIATFVEGKDAITSWTVRNLLLHFDRNRQPISRWHLDYAFWTFFIGLHFTDAEIFTLWCHFFPYGDGQGLNEAVNFYYNKRNMAQLDMKELITIVASMRAPLYYKRHPQELEGRVNDLFAEYSLKYKVE